MMGTETTKSQLRNRWKSENYFSEIPFIKDGKFIPELFDNADFRAASKLGIAEPFHHFPAFISLKLKNIDFTFGDGAIRVKGSEIDGFSFEEFKFNKASFFYQSTIKNSNFTKSKLILDFTDVIFENCDFSYSSFKGGHKEWGFKRCKFYNCNFSNAHWLNTYFFACNFINCTFNSFVIENTLIRGFKVNQPINELSGVFRNCEEISGLIQI